MKQLQHQQISKARRVKIEKMQKLLHANRRMGQKIIFEADAPAQRLSNVKDSVSGKVLTDEGDVKRVVPLCSVWCGAC